MTSKMLRSARDRIIVAVLLIAGVFMAWTCVRVTAIEILPDAPALAPHDPNAVLERAITSLVEKRAILDAVTLAAVRRAAVAAPLDARPYLILGNQQLLDRELGRGLATLEAGQRLDPRQVWIHVLLIDRYSRTGRSGEAASQMSVLARLIGQPPILSAELAKMILSPETRKAATLSVRSDPRLERAVLIVLAEHGTDPATIFALASPSARADAGRSDSWGPALINQLVATHRFAPARLVWQQVYGVRGPVPAIFNAEFRSLRAVAPFNWTVTAGEIGAAALQRGGLAIDYYGRDSGELASQLLILTPGAYRFSFMVDPGKSDTSSHLLWSLTCAGGRDAFMTVPVVAGPKPRRFMTDFVVPASCPAQKLALSGEAGDLPVPSNVTIRMPAISAQREAHP